MRTPRERVRNLPPFWGAREANVNNAWFDKVSIVFPENRFFNATPDELTVRFRQAATCGLIGLKSSTRYKIGGDQFLFSGEVHFRDFNKNTNRQVQRIKIFLEVNLSRFIRHHGLPSACRGPRRFSILRKNPNVREVALDGRDNFVPEMSLARARSTSWPTEMLCLLRFIQQEIDDHLDPENTIDDAPWTREEAVRDGRRLIYDNTWTKWQLPQVETYFEFRAPNAIAEIEHLRYLLPQLANDVQATHYRQERPVGRGLLPDQVLGTENQLASSQSLSIPLGVRGLRLGIYAKRHDRIRFEVRTYSGSRGSLSGHGTRAHLPNARSEDIPRFFRALAENASRRTTRFLNVLDRVRPSREPNVASLAMILAVLSHSCDGDRGLMTQFLREVIANGRISLSENADPVWQQMLDRLERNRVLEKQTAVINRTEKVYSVPAMYQGVFTVLRVALANTAREPASL